MSLKSKLLGLRHHRLPLDLELLNSSSCCCRTSPPFPLPLLPPPPPSPHRIQLLAFFSSAAPAAHRPRSPLSFGTLLPLRSSWRSYGGPHISPRPASLILPKHPFAKAHRSSSSAAITNLAHDGLRVLRISLQRRRGDIVDLGRLFSRAKRLWRNFMPTPDVVVLGLIVANVSVFALWHIADPSFMRKNFMISLDNFKSGRLHTLITSAFSHSDSGHLVSNMIGLYFFGTSIASLFGPNFLLNLYLAGALGGSIFYLVHKALMVPSTKVYHGWDESKVPALGASGAVNAIILLKVFLFPKDIYYLNLIIPVPAVLMGALLIGTDLWRMKQGEGNISGSAHLGGAVVAALVWARIKKRWI